MTLEQYLDCTVFTEPRSFRRREFTAFMLSQSDPLPKRLRSHAPSRGPAASG